MTSVYVSQSILGRKWWDYLNILARPDWRFSEATIFHMHGASRQLLCFSLSKKKLFSRLVGNWDPSVCLLVITNLWVPLQLLPQELPIQVGTRSCSVKATLLLKLSSPRSGVLSSCNTRFFFSAIGWRSNGPCFLIPPVFYLQPSASRRTTELAPPGHHRPAPRPWPLLCRHKSQEVTTIRGCVGTNHKSWQIIFFLWKYKDKSWLRRHKSQATNRGGAGTAVARARVVCEPVSNCKLFQ